MRKKLKFWQTPEGVKADAKEMIERMKWNEAVYNIPKKDKLKMPPTIRQQMFTTFVN